MLVFQTERLTVRRLTLADAPFMLAILNSEGFLNNIGDRGVTTVPQAEAYLIEGSLDSYQQNEFGMYAVTLTSTGEAIGLAGLVKREQLSDVDIGYALLPQYWRRGYALEAASGVVEHARALGFSELLGIVSPGNQASIQLLEKLGFNFDKVLQWDEDDEVLLYHKVLEIID